MNLPAAGCSAYCVGHNTNCGNEVVQCQAPEAAVLALPCAQVKEYYCLTTIYLRTSHGGSAMEAGDACEHISASLWPHHRAGDCAHQLQSGSGLLAEGLRSEPAAGQMYYLMTKELVGQPSRRA